MVQEGEVGGVHSCQNQTGAFKNWDRTKLPKHGENAQLRRHFEKGKEKRKKKYSWLLPGMLIFIVFIVTGT